MAELVFAPLNESGFRMLQTWFDDTELQRRYSYPTQQWYNYVQNEPGVYAWMILEDDGMVGHLQLDVKEDGTGYIGCYVKPDLRNRGYGKRILHALCARPEATRFHRLVAGVEPDNLASIRCMQAVGFIQGTVEPDEDGFIRFVLDFERSTDH